MPLFTHEIASKSRLLFLRVALLTLSAFLSFFNDALLWGVVRFQGNTTVTGRESAKSLYSSDLASMEIEGGGSIDYEPADAQASFGCACKRRSMKVVHSSICV